MDRMDDLMVIATENSEWRYLEETTAWKETPQMKMEEINEIFEKQYKECKLVRVEYLPDMGLYALDIDFDPEEMDPHNKKMLPTIPCINEKTKEIEYIEMLTYFDIDNIEEIWNYAEQ